MSFTTTRREFLTTSALLGAVTALPLPLKAQGSAATVPAVTGYIPPTPGHFLPVTDGTAVDGFFAGETPPALRCRSGQIVKIDTVNLAGMPRTGLEEFVAKNKIPVDDPAVREMISIRRHVPPSKVRGHMMNGPIFIEEAEPGDTLEVRVLAIEPRTSFGVNSGRPGGGGLPDLVSAAWTSVIWFDQAKKFALFSEGIRIPLAPFFGVMGLCPAPGRGRLSSIPPYLNLAGNLDNRHLGVGSTLYLPVQAKAVFFKPAMATRSRATVKSAALRSKPVSRVLFNLSSTRAGHRCSPPGPRRPPTTSPMVSTLNS